MADVVASLKSDAGLIKLEPMQRREVIDMRNGSSVLLDPFWAKQLGVTRTAGAYRIARSELIRKLSIERPGEPATCASIEGRSRVEGSSIPQIQEKRVA